MSKNKVYLSLTDKQKIVGKVYAQPNQIKAIAHQYTWDGILHTKLATKASPLFLYPIHPRADSENYTRCLKHWS